MEERNASNLFFPATALTFFSCILCWLEIKSETTLSENIVESTMLMSILTFWNSVIDWSLSIFSTIIGHLFTFLNNHYRFTFQIKFDFSWFAPFRKNVLKYKVTPNGELMLILRFNINFPTILFWKIFVLASIFTDSDIISNWI